MKKLLLALFISSLYSAPAFANSCRLNGKEIEFSQEDKMPGMNGEVSCISFAGKPDQENDTYIYKDGSNMEWRRDSAQAKFIEQYGYKNDRKVRNGLRIDYYPGTNQIEQKQHYVLERHEGLQESFYKSGKIKKREFWVKQHDTLDSDMQTATVSYDEHGKVSYFSCSKTREQNPEPKLCGFEQVAEEKKSGTKSGNRKVVYEKGKLISEEFPYDDSGTYSSVDRGTTPSEEVAIKRREYLSDGRVKITDIYKNGKIRRSAMIGKNGKFEGEDKEFFPEGTPARETIWESVNGQPVPKQTLCYYQNGKDKFLLQRNKLEIAAISYFDNGKKSFEGKFALPKDGEADASSSLFHCDGRLYQSNGSYSAWDEKGNLSEQGSFEKGKLASREFFENGKSTGKEEYYPDRSRK